MRIAVRAGPRETKAEKEVRLCARNGQADKGSVALDSAGGELRKVTSPLSVGNHDRHHRAIGYSSRPQRLT